jgi:hypothetical protein
MPDPTLPATEIVIVELKMDHGTLYAIPDAGHVRACDGDTLEFRADFPFKVEFTRLTGTSAPPEDGQAAPTGNGPKHSLSRTLDAAVDGAAPAYKYTIKVGGGASGVKVLDPIIIVDKKPGGH